MRGSNLVYKEELKRIHHPEDAGERVRKMVIVNK